MQRAPVSAMANLPSLPEAKATGRSSVLFPLPKRKVCIEEFVSPKPFMDIKCLTLALPGSSIQYSCFSEASLSSAHLEEAHPAAAKRTRRHSINRTLFPVFIISYSVKGSEQRL